MGATMRRSAAYAPTQNSIVERHGGHWKSLAKALILEYGISFHGPAWRRRWLTTSVTGACNASVNASGYFPSQWVLGKNLRLPYEMMSSTGRLAMQSRLGADKSFAERVSMMASAQRAVLSLKTSTALAKALAARSRATAAQPVQSLFAIGDQCFYWRGANVAKSAWSSRWHGPAVVLGFEANNVWLAHRGHAVKVAARHLRQALPEESVSWEHLYDSALASENKFETTADTSTPSTSTPANSNNLPRHGNHDHSNQQRHDGEFLNLTQQAGAPDHTTTRKRWRSGALTQQYEAAAPDGTATAIPCRRLVWCARLLRQVDELAVVSLLI